MNILLNAYYKGGTSTGGPLSISAANTGTAFDTSVLGGVGEAVCVVTIGAIASDATVLKIQESDDNSTWTDVSGGSFSGTGLPTTASGANKQWLFHVRTGGIRKRYLRVACTPGGTTLFGAVWIGLHGSTGVNGTTETLRSVAQNVGDGTYLGRIVL
jgi:hypothetical protein